MAGPRLFDHDEAVVRHALGWSYRELAVEYGVTTSAIGQAILRQTDPEWRQRQVLYHREYQRRTLKVPCLRCGKPVWKKRGKEQRSGLCIRCVGADKATSVRPTKLRCSECGWWLPDKEFPFQRANVARRGRHSVCTPCGTEAKRAWRHRNPEKVRAYDRAYRARRRKQAA
jgi:hypothetical protein